MILRLALILAVGFVCAQSQASWPDSVEDIRYFTTADGTLQPAKYYAPSTKKPVPLLVGLHTWSSDYEQTGDHYGGPYAQWCIEKGWAFIHPSFRGPNRRPEACGSELAVDDILSAVQHVKGRVAIDEDRIYLVGVSGGGHASLLMAGRRPDLWAGVSAWVGISDLAAWHRECKTAGRRYAGDLEGACGGAPGASRTIDLEYRRRSPLTWLPSAVGVNLDINVGIRDGHTGSVPVSHSLRAFNAVADQDQRFKEAELKEIDRTPNVPPRLRTKTTDPDYGDKQPLLRRQSGTARVTIFDGGHEIISKAALRWLEKQRRRPRPARVRVGTRKQLLVDDLLIEKRSGVERVLGRPKKHGVVLRPKLPTDFIPPKGRRGERGYDKGLASGKKPDGSGVALDFGYYTTVAWNEHQKKFQMWYMAWRYAGVGYAESKDGIHWSQPLVGPSGMDNVVHRGQGFSCFVDPAVPWGSPEKFKAASDIGEDGFGGPRSRVGLSYSPDGIHWTHYNDGRSVSHRAADTQNQLLWDPIRSKYLLVTRTDLGAGGGAGESRSSRIMEHRGGNDLRKRHSEWRTIRDRIIVDDPKREKVKWSQKVPRLQLNSTTLWVHEGIYFAFFDVYTMDRYDFFDGYEYEERHEEDIMDFCIGTSRDGVTFDRSWIHARKPFVPRGSAGSFDKDGVKPPSVFVTRGDEHWIYYGGMNERHYSRGRHLEIGLAKLPRDRLIGFSSGDTPGQLTTKPFRVEGAALEINVEAPRGEIAVEVLDPKGQPLLGFQRADGGVGREVDSIRWRPRWTTNEDLSSLLGETVRLRVHLKTATVFAFQLK
ncbi:MAG: prolyl oligopeptidase family serine peptidase [Planctomycetota bacterium]